MEISLKGKVALVTGASRGIGLAIAKTFAESGASVMMVSRKIDESSMEGIDGEVAIRPANVGDPTAAVDVVRETIEKFGRLDILVNNAATNPYYGPTLGVDESRYEKTFQVNLKAPIQWTQAAYEASFKDNPGVIINIASVGGLRTDGGGLGIYNLTKAALIHYTPNLQARLGRTELLALHLDSSRRISRVSWWKTSVIRLQRQFLYVDWVNHKTLQTLQRFWRQKQQVGLPVRHT